MKHKQIRSLFCLLLTAVLLFSLSACGGGPQEARTVTEAPPAADSPEFNRQLRITLDGDLYTAPALVEGDTVYLGTNTLRALLGVEPKATVTVSGQPCASLEQAAKDAGAARYIPDLSLDSVYLWTDLPKGRGQDGALQRIPEGRESADPVPYGEFFTMLDAAVESVNPEGLQRWKASQPEARAANRNLVRGEAMLMLLSAAIAMGPEFTEFNAEWLAVDNAMPGLWEEVDQVMAKHDLFAYLPNPNPCGIQGFYKDDYIQEWDYFGVAMRYCSGRVSLRTGQPLLDFDWEHHTLRIGDLLTMEEAANAVTRLLDSVPSPEDLIPSDSPRACTLNTDIMTPELMALAEEMPPISREDPAVLNAAVLGMEYTAASLDAAEMERHARVLSQWGFNAMRYGIPYHLLFSRDGSSVSISALEQLDQIVASAARYRIHFNLLLITLPGRWLTTDDTVFTSQGEFDMFTNPQRQAEAFRVWETLARRYRDVPASLLSFSPCWESTNPDLSSGLPADPISQTDVSAFHRKVTELIRQENPDRCILYEPTAVTALNVGRDDIAQGVQAMEPNYPNTQVIVNFCLEPYVYAEMNDEPGENVDFNNHSMFKPPYPVTIYGAGCGVSSEAPMVFDGDLQGARLDLYLDRVNRAGDLQILGDGQLLHEEQLSPADYRQDPPASRFYPFAKSEKLISVSLPEDLETLEITFTGDLFWSGIDLILPEALAQDRWWFPSAYDAFLQQSETRFPDPELRRTSTVRLSPGLPTQGPIHIHGDSLSYSTDTIEHQANRDTVFSVGEELFGITQNASIRLERAGFNVGTQADSALTYYGDFLDMCDHYGFGWLTNDYCYEEMLGNSPFVLKYPGAERIPSAEGFVWKELLQLYQAHMPAPTPLEP